MDGEEQDKINRQFLNVLGDHEGAMLHMVVGLAKAMVDKGLLSYRDITDAMETLNVDTGEGTNRLVDNHVNALNERSISRGE